MSDVDAVIGNSPESCNPPRVPTGYDALICYGFSPFKAIEIILDGKRNNPYALAFIKLALESQHL